jgi:hypothetical protein
MAAGGIVVHHGSAAPAALVSPALAALRDRLADGHRRGFNGTPWR